MKKKMIGDEEIINIGSKIASEYFSNIYMQVGLFLAMTLAEVFDDEQDEQDEQDKQEYLYIGCNTYNVGPYTITIESRSDDKVRLGIVYKGKIIVDRILDSLHKAYEYAFNILIAH